jgi:hypothetical protein
MIGGVAKTFYKGERLGSSPPCAICAGKGMGERRPLTLTHGLTVWLCAAHREESFLRRRRGRDLVATLLRVWGAAGCLDRPQHAALDAHLRRLAAPPPGRRPGSYAWPGLRREAERRFAAGEPPGPVIADLRARHGGEAARVPAARTMRRWFAEGRWLAPRPARVPTSARPARPAGAPEPGEREQSAPHARARPLLGHARGGGPVSGDDGSENRGADRRAKAPP